MATPETTEFLCNVLSGLVERLYGSEAAFTVIITVPLSEGSPEGQTNITIASNLEDESVKELLVEVANSSPMLNRVAPGEATAEDLKAEDGDLSDVRPGEVGGVTH